MMDQTEVYFLVVFLASAFTSLYIARATGKISETIWLVSTIVTAITFSTLTDVLLFTY